MLAGLALGDRSVLARRSREISVPRENLFSLADPMKTPTLALPGLFCAVIAAVLCSCAVRGSASSPIAFEAAPAEPAADTGEEPKTTSEASQRAGDADAADELFMRAHAKFAEAHAAKERGDHVAARARVSEAIEDLLTEDDRSESAARIATLSELGDFAYDAGDLKGSERARRRALEIRTRTLPDDHPDVLKARQNLAQSIFELGDLVEARTLLEQVLDVYSRTLPDDHSDLQVARGNLAVTIRELGDLAGARALEEKALGSTRKRCPTTIPTCRGRGSTWR